MLKKRKTMLVTSNMNGMTNLLPGLQKEILKGNLNSLQESNPRLVPIEEFCTSTQ